MLNFNEIKKLTPAELLTNQEFREHIVVLYNTCHKTTDGNQFYERETNFLKKLMMDNAKIAKASSISIMSTLLDLAYHGLSIEPVSKAQAYIVPRSHNLGTKDNPQWEQRVLLVISAYGELALRVRSGIIRYVDGPYLVYAGDHFTTTPDGCIEHVRNHESDEVTDAWIKITRYDGSTECKEFSIQEIMAYKKKSDTPTSTAWTGGVDGQPSRGMIEAKVLRHSFSAYPRLKLGQNTTVQTDDDIAADAAYAAAIADLSTDQDNGITTHEEVPSKPQQRAKAPAAEQAEIVPPTPPTDEIPIFKF